jgi:hypothetical protein
LASTNDLNGAPIPHLADYPRAMVYIKCDKCGGEGCAAKPPDRRTPNCAHAKGSAREIRELVPLSPVALTDLKNEVSFMTANNVTPFEVFKSFVEFYPNLGATIAFGTMAAAARMIPNSGAAISDAPQAKRPELVSPATNSTPRKRSTAHKKPRKASKRATGRRKAA